MTSGNYFLLPDNMLEINKLMIYFFRANISKMSHKTPSRPHSKSSNLWFNATIFCSAGGAVSASLSLLTAPLTGHQKAHICLHAGSFSEFVLINISAQSYLQSQALLTGPGCSKQVRTQVWVCVSAFLRDRDGKREVCVCVRYISVELDLRFESDP